jgi:hypothetical protein
VYLGRQDKPNKEEKICMVNSLMEAFPHLKSIDSPVSLLSV